jgi:hypothetical protein
MGGNLGLDHLALALADDGHVDRCFLPFSFWSLKTGLTPGFQPRSAFNELNADSL